MKDWNNPTVEQLGMKDTEITKDTQGIVAKCTNPDCDYVLMDVCVPNSDTHCSKCGSLMRITENRLCKLS